jgi:predicted MarR family transcription regulator
LPAAAPARNMAARRRFAGANPWGEVVRHMKAASASGIHLGQSEIERELYELQHAAICYMEAFYRYIEMQLHLAAGETNLSGADCVILHAIRIGDRPKSIRELQLFTNRSDIANIQYSVKKLAAAGLVERTKLTKRAAGQGAVYALTARGRTVSVDYVRARKSLIAMIPQAPASVVGDSKIATRLLLQLTGLYDHVSRSLAS